MKKIKAIMYFDFKIDKKIRKIQIIKIKKILKIGLNKFKTFLSANKNKFLDHPFILSFNV